MRNTNIFLIMLYILIFSFKEIQAQEQLNINENHRTITSFELIKIKSLCFTNCDILIKRNDLSVDTFALYKISNLNFMDLMTEVPEFNGQFKTNILILQNPIDDQLQISLESANDEIATIEIVNMQGNILCIKNIQVVKGINLIMVPATNFARGVYVCRLRFNSKFEEIKLMKK